MKLMMVYPDCKVQIAILITDKTLIIVPIEYLDFVNVFSKKSAKVLPQHIEINIYVIDLEEGIQLLYSPIYSQRMVELETLKTYIKTNQANGFTQLFKFFACGLILFNKNLIEIFGFVLIIKALMTLPSKTNIHFHL